MNGEVSDSGRGSTTTITSFLECEVLVGSFGGGLPVSWDFRVSIDGYESLVA